MPCQPTSAAWKKAAPISLVKVDIPMPLRAVYAALFVLSLIACSDGGTSPEETSTPPQTSNIPLIACQNPRPEICTFEYNPVCGQGDTGIRCITTPCPSSEWRTYSNTCSACSDSSVAGYVPGACEDPANSAP